VAKEMGREATFKPSEVGVYFGEPGKTVPDPYFGGKGPARSGCQLCGGCMVGCRHGAKNTLDRNYLYFAEKAGARIMPETQVTDVRPLGGGRGEKGWELELTRTTAWLFKGAGTVRARRVVFSAGVLGTMRLLLRCKHVTKSLPHLSERLGEEVRTNSETLVGLTLLDPPPERDVSRGVAISSIFHPDDHTHIEPVRYPRGSSFMKGLAAPMADGTRVAWHRPFRMALAALVSPVQTLRLLLNRRWAESTIILLVMQTLDNKMRLRLGRNPFTLFRRRMTTDLGKGVAPIPTYIPIANQVARTLARKLNGVPQSMVNEVVLNIPTTAHILGGCPIGGTPSTGVIDKDHRVFGYEGLTVCDGSAIPANLGVNPSLTITAMTERAMSKVPAKS
jgi:cholesterol oxidase